MPAPNPLSYLHLTGVPSYASKPLSVNPLAMRVQSDAGVDVDGDDISKVPGPILSFDELALPPILLKVMGEKGITTPSPIQSTTIPIMMSGRDCIVLAETGSGKTLAYVLPLFCFLSSASTSNLCLPQRCAPIALILAPTRELAIQIYDEVRALVDEVCIQAGMKSRSPPYEVICSTKDAFVLLKKSCSVPSLKRILSIAQKYILQMSSFVERTTLYRWFQRL
mmetsp:Transcript_45150/g.116796  ORF Transcript_45150/g.116796 Transcript_45150/m.116796 type:complete len:223 (-) Transcript_45150:1399-2067(-)